MKTVKYLFATIVLGICLTSCGDSFLNTQPEGGVLLESQFALLPDNLKGSIMGIYSKLYEYGGQHDLFGIRCLDLSSDLQSGDIAMANNQYNWWDGYERGMIYSYAACDAREYNWEFYYAIINLTNISAVAVEANVPEIMASIGSTEPLVEKIMVQGYYYGQILALRGWAYSGLLRYYCDPMDKISAKNAALAFPLYREEEYKSGRIGGPRATVQEVYDQVYKDLSTAVTVLDYYGKLNTRASKLEVDVDVARLFLAYAMLNYGDDTETIGETGKNASQLAFDYATAAINNGKYPMLKYADLLTTGFADVNATNWMWGQDVTVETTTKLASFFGQVDIHTYSYALVGDTKAIDSKLYDQIAAQKWDARVKWFRDGNQNYAYCPDGKFYNPATKNTTDQSKVDRDWLCDNIFMRIELAYLIAAEAAWRLGNEGDAKNYLKLLCDERVFEDKATEYQTWLDGLTGDALKEAIIYNWRVEMWGEGFGLQTFRRLSKTVTLGSNHMYRAGNTITVEDNTYTNYQCDIPDSEIRYNPYLNNRTSFVSAR